ncbi:MAG: UGSC family (seleno)protein, partial [Actinomycetota bacterium]
LAQTLASRTGAEVAVVTKKGPRGESANAAVPMARDVLDRLVGEADLVITGAADCGSCTAYSVHDAIELEALGIPAVVVTTTMFEPVATTLSANFGLADSRRLVLPHPLGGTDEATLDRWADAAVDELLALFTGRA